MCTQNAVDAEYNSYIKSCGIREMERDRERERDAFPASADEDEFALLYVSVATVSQSLLFFLLLVM